MLTIGSLAQKVLPSSLLAKTVEEGKVAPRESVFNQEPATPMSETTILKEIQFNHCKTCIIIKDPNELLVTVKKKTVEDQINATVEMISKGLPPEERATLQQRALEFAKEMFGSKKLDQTWKTVVQ
ncbi:MAG: hypothetical protein AABZ14_09395 [Candidatus Margulisiibacteriota bacterium]